MKFSISAFLLVLTISAAQAQKCGDFQKTWFICVSDSDCVVDYNMCGFLIAINKKYRDANGRLNKCMGPMISCAVPPQDQNKEKTQAECKINKCEIVKSKS